MVFGLPIFRFGLEAQNVSYVHFLLADSLFVYLKRKKKQSNGCIIIIQPYFQRPSSSILQTVCSERTTTIPSNIRDLEKPLCINIYMDLTCTLNHRLFLDSWSTGENSEESSLLVYPFA